MFKGILHTTRGEQHCRLDVVGNTLVVCTDCSIVGIEELLLNGRTTPQRLTCPPPLIVIMSLPPPPPSVAPYQPHNIQMGKVQCTLKRGTEAAVITPYVLFTFTMCRSGGSGDGGFAIIISICRGLGLCGGILSGAGNFAVLWRSAVVKCNVNRMQVEGGRMAQRFVVKERDGT